jgi:hypothetical protein
VFSDTIDVAGRTHDYVVVDASLRHPKTVLVQASGVTA